MFRDDICRVLRPKKEKINGEVIYLDPEVVYEFVPCHLSRGALAPAEQSQSTATVDYKYTLFTDNKYIIRPNDIIEVTTLQQQYFKLRAGQTKRYRLTAQTNCEVLKIV